MKVFLTGATGFVGRNMTTRLLQEGHSVRALARLGKDRAFPPASHGNLEYVAGDVVSGEGLETGVAGCDAVIHLVGIIVEQGKQSFESVHHLGTRNVVAAARKAGVGRFVQMSALGVRANGVAAYQRTKWAGEEEVRHSGLPFCILRPSLIVGPEAGFITQMLGTMRRAPVFRPVPGDGRPLFRPIYIDDLTACFSRALSAPSALGRTIELGGADELPLEQVLREIARAAGIRKPAVHIPLPLMTAGAFLAERLLPTPPVTVDQLRMLREGSTCDITVMQTTLGVQPVGFSAALSRFLRKE